MLKNKIAKGTLRILVGVTLTYYTIAKFNELDTLAQQQGYTKKYNRGMPEYADATIPHLHDTTSFSDFSSTTALGLTNQHKMYRLPLCAGMGLVFFSGLYILDATKKKE